MHSVASFSPLATFDPEDELIVANADQVIDVSMDKFLTFARLHPGAEKTQADKQGLRKTATYEVQEKIFEVLNKTGLNDANHWEALATRLGGPAGRHVLRSGILGPCADPAFAPLAVRAFGGSPDKAIHRLRINQRRRKRLKRWIGSLRRQLESLTTFH